MSLFPVDSKVIYDQEGNPTYDREITSAEFAEMLGRFFGDGVFLDKNGNPYFQVTPYSNSPMSVFISPGAAMLNGHYFSTAGVHIVGLEASTKPHVDLIILRMDLNTAKRSVSLTFIRGDSAEEPVAKYSGVIRNQFLYDLVLAEVTVPAGATAITQDMIRDMRAEKITLNGVETHACGIVQCPLVNFDYSELLSSQREAFETWFGNIQTILDGNDTTQLAREVQALKDALGTVDTSAGTIAEQVVGAADGAVAIERIWTNPNPPTTAATEATTFNAGDIALNGIDLSAYDAIDVEFCHCGVYFKKGSSSKAVMVDNPQRNMRYHTRIMADTTGVTVGVWSNGTAFSRPVTFDRIGGKISVLNATYGKTTAPTTFASFYTRKSNGKVGNSTPNIVMIPVAIYGVKHIGDATA